MAVLSPQRIQVLPENGLPAHGIDQGDLHACQLDICRHQVNSLGVVQNALPKGDGFVGQDLPHHIREGCGKLVGLGIPQPNGHAGLGVGVQQQHFSAFLRQTDAQVDTSSTFAHAALLIDAGNDLCFHGAPYAHSRTKTRVTTCSWTGWEQAETTAS